MSDTPASAARHAALIVAHGSPSRPDAPERAIRDLAERAQAHLPPGWRVRGATLAKPGALEAAVAAFSGDDLLVYPHFMSDGWFTSYELARRLRLAGAATCQILNPFGLDAAIAPLCLRRAREAIGSMNADPEEVALILAAHGSPSDPRPGRAARALADQIAAQAAFREVRLGFIDEPPAIDEAARGAGLAVCLPLFIGRSGHVTCDLPAGLEAAGFDGPVLPPLGRDPEAPGIIADALVRSAPTQAPFGIGPAS